MTIIHCISIIRRNLWAESFAKMPYKVGDKTVYGLGERSSGFKPRSLDGFQNFQKIVEKCRKEAYCFEDDEFPADVTSLGKIEGGESIKWKRPHEICRRRRPHLPQFIVDQAERFDVNVNQGYLGNGCLVAAISDLTLSPEHFQMVVPDDNKFGKEYTGAFHFRFWQFGKWIDIVIDDRLPCNGDDLAFMSSQSQNEFWSPLLEKAYAKLKGSYAVLEGGLIFEALEDFTGGFTEVLVIENLFSAGLVKDNSEFYDLIKSSFERKSFMGASLKVIWNDIPKAKRQGLIPDHAYSITDVQLFNINLEGQSGQVRLLRIRNPYGTEKEWTGDWSDGSKYWKSVPEEEITKYKVLYDADGESWISLEDFLEKFERIEVCHITPHSNAELVESIRGVGNGKTKKWKAHALSGDWSHNVTAGGSQIRGKTYPNNPQYILDIGEPSGKDNTLIVCLLKKERTGGSDGKDCKGVKKVSINVFPLKKNSPRPLGFEFFQDSSNESLPYIYPFHELREITIRFSVPSGRYVIIPSTQEPNQEGHFLLRVFTEGRSTLELYDEDVYIEEKEVEVTDDSPEEKANFKKAQEFFKYVAGDHDEVNWWNLKLLLDKSFHDEFRYEGFGFSEDSCRSMVALLDADRSGKLGFYEFSNLWAEIIAWKKIFNKHDEDNSTTLGTLKTNELREALREGGCIVNKDILENIVLRYGDKNGEVALDKFIIAALKLKTMIELFKRHEIPNGNAKISSRDWINETLYS